MDVQSDLMIDTKPLNPTIQIKNLDVVTPTGQCLCANINVDIDPCLFN